MVFAPKGAAILASSLAHPFGALVAMTSPVPGLRPGLSHAPLRGGNTALMARPFDAETLVRALIYIFAGR